MNKKKGKRRRGAGWGGLLTSGVDGEEPGGGGHERGW